MRTDLIRREFQQLNSITYLNHAAIGLIPNRARDYIENYLNDLLLNGPDYGKDKAIIEETRTIVADLLNCKTTEIAFVPNTSSGISKIAQGLRINKNELIGCIVPDFPSNIYPWLNLARKGIKAYFINVDYGSFSLESIEKQLLPNTRLLAVSHVNYVTGFRVPLEELSYLCQKNGILLAVDMIQSLGIIPVEMSTTKIDFMAAGAHKWMMGLPGLGILYISERARDQVVVQEVGWKSVKQEEDFAKIDLNLKDDASAMEPGTMNTLGIISLKAGIQMLMEFGVREALDCVLSWNMDMASMIERLGFRIVSPVGSERSSGILSFHSNNNRLLFEFLRKNKIVTSLRNGFIRISPHYYNNESDSRKLFNGLRNYAAKF